MGCLKDFTSSIEAVSEVDPAIKRWFYGTRQLERELSERVVYLCLYYDRIPTQSQLEYADILLETLRSGDFTQRAFVSDRIGENIREFATFLEQSGDTATIEKGRLLREAIQAGLSGASRDL